MRMRRPGVCRKRARALCRQAGAAGFDRGSVATQGCQNALNLLVLASHGRDWPWGMQVLDSTEEPIPAAVKAVLKAKVELLVRRVTTQQKAAAAAKQVLCPRP